MIKDLEYLSPLGKSDHIVITFNIKCHRMQDNREKISYCYDKGDYEAMTKDLSDIDWTRELYKRKNINEQWLFIKETLNTAIKKHIPRRTVRARGKKGKGQLDKKTREIIRKKHRAWQRYRESQFIDETKLQIYRRLRNKVRKITRRLQKNREKDVANTAKANPKKFWQYINRTTKIVTGIGDLETPSNGLTGNDKDKAEILANFFSSVFTQENMENMPTVTMSKSNGGLKSYEIGVEDVRKKLSILNPNKSPGSDKLHPRILREMKNVLDKPLTMLYQETLTTGMIPDDWKHAKVTAIFKKGEKRSQITIDR